RRCNVGMPGWQGQQSVLLDLQTLLRALASGAVYALVGDVAQPRSDAPIGAGDIQGQAGATEGCGQGDDEAALQITVEAFHLALCASPIRTAHAWYEPVMFGQLEQLGVPAVLALTIDIALDDNRLGVVEQHRL